MTHGSMVKSYQSGWPSSSSEKNICWSAPVKASENRMPPAPPASASKTDSLRSCRIRRKRPAPKETRTADSRVRAAPLASAIPARFAQFTASSTRPTSSRSLMSNMVVSLRSAPRSERTTVPLLSPSSACSQRGGMRLAISAPTSWTVRPAAIRPNMLRIVQSSDSESSHQRYPTPSIIAGM